MKDRGRRGYEDRITDNMISSQTDMKKGRQTDMNAHRHKDTRTKYIITGRQEDRQTCKPEF